MPTFQCLKPMLILLTVVTFLVVSATTLPAATVELEQEVHFVAPSGDNVVLEAGTYTVEPAEKWLRLIPKGGNRVDAVLLNADVSSPNQSLSDGTPNTPQVRSFSSGEDEHYLVLLRPNGQSWMTVGSYSGVRARGTASQDVVLKYGVNFLKSDNSNIYENYWAGEMSLGFCLMRCEKRPQCQGFTWNPGKKQCYILKSLNSAQGVSNPSSISGFSRSRFAPTYSGSTQQQNVIVPENNVLRPGRTLGPQTFGTSLEECHLRCAGNPQCKSFNWLKPGKRSICNLGITEGKARSDPRWISGVKKLWWDALYEEKQERYGYWTPLKLQKCIKAALRGPKKQYVKPIYGQGWNCAPLKAFPVQHPQFKSQVLQELFPAAYEQALRSQRFPPKTIQRVKDDFFNKFSKKLKLFSAPANTHVLIGYVSHPRKGKNDVAYYTIAVSRVSAEKIRVHSTSIDYRAGGVFRTPILGKLLEVAITQAVSYLTGGIPFTGTLAVSAIKKIANQGRGGTKANANNIVGAIALSAEPILPKSSSLSASFRSVNFPTHFIRHRNFVVDLTPVQTDLDKKDASFVMVRGLGDSKGVSFESVNFPGHYLRHQNFRVRLQRLADNALFRADATFYPVPGLADATKSSFRSMNFPDRFLRHRNFQLFIEPNTGGPFGQDATFLKIPGLAPTQAH